MSDTLAFTEQLISRASVTPHDAGCQELIAQRLTALGFECETVVSGPDDFRVTNLWAKRKAPSVNGQPAPLLVFAGHTDVVPTGPITQWTSDPFVPTHRDGFLFGRGASDMKTSIAAMVVACEKFFQVAPQAPLSVAFLITSDEEGPSVDGTKIMCDWLQARGETLDYCIVGEPTSVLATGDMIKNGRRGTLSGKLRVKGIQGHIAYPQLADNPIHKVAPALALLVATQWDQGNAFFPPTTWQVSNIHGGTGASNVIPGEVVIDFNFRFSTESTAEGLKLRVGQVLTQAGLRPEADYELNWTLGGEPFLTTPGPLVNAVRKAIEQQTGIQTELSTTGGTSDGRFIARICPQVIELGPPNATIHKIDECVAVRDIAPLEAIYHQVLGELASLARVGK
jgi:succinyl-diaminopimelate desuccinylase